MILPRSKTEYPVIICDEINDIDQKINSDDFLYDYTQLEEMTYSSDDGIL